MKLSVSIPLLSFLVLTGIATSSVASAQNSTVDYTIGSLTIRSPWIRATPKGAAVGGGYMTITNNGKESDRLVGGTLPNASHVEIHEMKMESDVMLMRPLKDGLEIKPGQTVTLAPGGYHVMFMGLRKPLIQGEHIKGELVFKNAGSVAVDYAVAGIGAATPAPVQGH